MPDRETRIPDILAPVAEGIAQRESPQVVAGTAATPAASICRVDLIATLTEGRQHFSDLVELAKSGKIILLHERGKPRAMIVPIPLDRLCMRSAKKYKKVILYNINK
jgi:hypothetical protein